MRRKRHDLFLDKEFSELPETEFVIPLDSEDSDLVAESSLVSMDPEDSFEDSEKLEREESMLDRSFPEEKKFPCGKCSDEVNDDDDGVCCDSCSKWYHCQFTPSMEKQFSELVNNSH